MTWPRTVRATTELFTLPVLKIQPVETLAGSALQSRLHIIIQHIHNETLGQTSSYGLDVTLHMVTNSVLYSVQ